MTILAMLITWGFMLILSLLATFIFIVRFSRTHGQGGYNGWHPAQCYEWERNG